MKINLVSDLHLEFCPIELPGGETLLLAGDICVADYLRPERTDKEADRLKEHTSNFFKMVNERYDHAFYIMGNHEHYRGIFEEDHKVLRQFLAAYPKVQLLDKASTELTANTRLFGATMWTDYDGGNPVFMDHAMRCMNDHHLIYHNYKAQGSTQPATFMPADALEEYKWTLRRLEKELELWSNQNFLVMTHHCPTSQSVHSMYKGDPLNYAFANELGEFILDNPRIKYWVHGHTHHTFKYSVGTCQVYCNPRGYTRSVKDTPENAAFDANFAFEVL